MIRGTTAAFKFKLPHKLRYITQLRVVFWQNGYSGTLGNSLPKVKTYHSEDFKNLDSNEFVVILRETDTKAFTDTLKARVQMKGLHIGYTDENGNVIEPGSFGSDEQLFTVYPMNDGIIDGDISEDTTVTNEGYIVLDGENIISGPEAGEN